MDPFYRLSTVLLAEFQSRMQRQVLFKRRDGPSTLGKIHGLFWIIAGTMKLVHIFLCLLAISYRL